VFAAHIDNAAECVWATVWEEILHQARSTRHLPAPQQPVDSCGRRDLHLEQQTAQAT